MNNPLIQSQAPQMNIADLFGQFKQNPLGFLTKQKFNIPQELANNPQGMIQHLLNSGQINQSQLNQAQQMYSQMFGRRN